MCNSSRTQRLLFQLKDIQELTQYRAQWCNKIRNRAKIWRKKLPLKSLNCFISMNKLNIFGIFSEYSSRRSSWPCELWIKMSENVNFSLWGKWRNLSYIIISCTIFFHFLVYCDRDEATGSVIGHWNCIRKKIELGIFNWFFSFKFFFSS